MALSTNLVRRGGIYYFRCRVPNDLVARLGRAELSRSLATANPDVARRRGRRAAHLVEQVWLLVRECMSPEQIDDVIRRWLKAELDKDELARTNTAFAGDYAAQRGIDVKVVASQMFGSDAAAKMDEWLRHAQDARWEEAEPWAKTIIRDQELPIAKGSDEYRLLCLRLLPALVDFHDIRLERSEGNWTRRIELLSAPVVASELLPPKEESQPLKDAISDYLASQRHSRNRDKKRILKIEGSLSLFSQWTNPNAWVKQWLYLDLLKEPITEDEESDLGVTYGFHFWPDAPTPTAGHFWLKVGKILDFNSENKFDDFKDQLWDEVADDTPKSKERVFRKNLDRLYRLVWKDEVIAYYTEKDQSYDRVLDIFVRANDGGTKLSKSDLLLSTFTSKWSGVNAREEIYDFVERLNGDLDRKNSFNKDLIMRACLVLSDLDTHYVTDNFTNKNLRIIEQNWPRIKKSIEYTVRLVNRFGFDRDTLTSSNALLPIAYYLFKTGPTLLDGETQFDVANADRIRRWLIIALLNGVFGGASSNTLRSARTILQEQLLASKDFPIAGLIDGLKEQAGHRAVIEGNDASGFLDTRYTSKTSFTALSLLYDERNWGTTLYHIDHIIPKSMCTPSELRKQDIPEALIPRIAEACDRIGNLQLLPASENITKSNMPFSEWIRTRDQSFLERHMIPSDPDLWHPRALPDFVREREKMIQRRVIKVLNIDQASPEGTGGNPLLAAV